MLDFIKNISPTELIIIVVIFILLFGAKAVTSLARTGGETVKEIKKVKREFTKALEDDDSKPSKSQRKGVAK